MMGDYHTDPVEVVDVSAAQAPDDLDIVAARRGGLLAVINKLTEGATHLSPTWKEHARSTNGAALLLGYYHFAWPNDPVEEDAEKEAWKFIDRVRELEEEGIYADLLPTLDLEKGKKRVSSVEMVRWAARWAEVVCTTLQVPRVIVYANRSYTRLLNRGAKKLGRTLGLEKHLLWIAGDTPEVPAGIWTEAGLWQTPRRDVSWCEGAIDCNVLLAPIGTLMVEPPARDARLDELEQLARRTLTLVTEMRRAP